MQKPESSLATIWQIVLRLAELYGLDTDALIREVGLSRAVMNDVRARLPSRLTDIACTYLSERIPDPAFALRAAGCWHPSNLGTMGYAWLSSRTLHTGLKRIERFSRILGTRFSYYCLEEEGGLRLVFDHGRGEAEVGHVLSDFFMSVLFDMCRTNAGRQLNAKAVELRRHVPDDPSPWSDFYGSAVVFDGARDSILLDADSANAPLPTANIPLANTFDAILTEQLATFFEDDIVSRCKACLLRHLTTGEPAAQAVARELGMSQRSLQRRLAELHLTYQGVLDETRHELARRYLDDAAKSVTEITFLLGFSEQSAFTRAFRRWSGMSPSGYRGVVRASE